MSLKTSTGTAKTPDVHDLLTALALLLVIEGLLYAAFPGGMRRLLAQVMEMPSQVLRSGGLVAAVVGIGCLWLLRG